MRPFQSIVRGRGAAPVAAALAAATLLAPAGAATASAAAARPPRRRAGPPAPAVAVGRSIFPEGRWRLEGRRLTVRLARPLVADDGPASRVVRVRCAEKVVSYANAVADAVERRTRVRAGAREIAVVLGRDLARRVNRCALEVEAEPPAWDRVDARMRLVRGTPPGCAPGRRERVAFRTRGVLVTHVRAANVDWTGAERPGWHDAFRFCRRPGGRLLPLTALWSNGPGVDERRIVRFAHAGHWLAWAVGPGGSADGRDAEVVYLLDLRAALRRSPTRFEVGSPRPVELAGLAVATTGAVAWVQRSAGDGDAAEQQLRVGWAHGGVETVDRATGPPADAIADPAFGPGGRAVTWRRAGARRRAALAPEGPRDPAARGAVAVGASRRPAARFRLAGRELTVVLARRLTPRGFRGRPSVRVVCGDSAQDPAAIASLDWQLLAAAGERLLRVRPGARTIRTRLSADVAARANWCGLRWRSRAGNHGLHAVMRLRRGTPPACAPTVREQVVAENDELLVTRVVTRPTERVHWREALRACAKRTRARHPLDVGGGSEYDGISVRLVALAGRWLAVTAQGYDKYHRDYACQFTLVDAAGVRAERIAVPAVPAGEEPRGRCPYVAALSATGRLAWILSAGWSGERDRVLARAADGAVAVVAEGPAGALRDLAIGPDGATATWSEHGAPRSAPLP